MTWSPQQRPLFAGLIRLQVTLTPMSGSSRAPSRQLYTQGLHPTALQCKQQGFPHLNQEIEVPTQVKPDTKPLGHTKPPHGFLHPRQATCRQLPGYVAVFASRNMRGQHTRTG
jgi:hypothetical protein